MGVIKKECQFKGSSLESTLMHTNKIKLFYGATKSALNMQPNSKFWQEAFNLIEKRFLKLKR